MALKQIGEISMKDWNEIHWKIHNIFSYTKQDKSYRSPQFSVLNYNYFLELFPYGETHNNSIGWINVYLRREDSAKNEGINFTFGVKKLDGAVEPGIEYPKLFERSKLLERKTELTPSSFLTVSCNLKVVDSFDCTSILDALSQNLADMFISQRGCDVTLKVQNKEFPAHKSILLARSSVFATMFEVDMKEKNSGVVHIKDCHPEDFKNFLMYLYSGKVENLSRNAFELYRISHKYDVKELKSVCLLSIMTNVSVENVCDILALAKQFGETVLESRAQDFFNENLACVFNTTKWKSLLKENPALADELLVKMAAKIKLKSEQ